MARIIAVITCLVFAVTSMAWAEDVRSPSAPLAQQPTSAPPTPVPAPRTETTAPIVVTATKIEESLERVGAAVTVITEDELKTYNYPTVGDALRRVPGLEVQRSGGLGKLTEIRIRGTTPQQVQVLIDGVRVKSPTSGDFDFSDLSADQIERIEIVRGPQSTLYGADAIGGVVNIITKRGTGPFSVYASSEVGNLDTLRERVGFSGTYRIFDYAASASWFESNGQGPNDGFEQRALSSRVGVALPADGHVGLSFRYNRNATDLPVSFAIPTRPFFVFDPDTRQQSETTTLSLQWDQKPVSWFEFHVRLGQFWNSLGFQNRFTSGDITAGNFDAFNTDSQIDTQRREAEVVAAFHLGRWDTVTVGAEHRTESGRNRTIGVFEEGDRQVFSKQFETRSFFAQNELRLVDRVILGGGGRYDHNSVFGSATTPRASAVLLIPESGSKLRGTWGEGFRAPTLNDLFFPGFGNPQLKPEHSESWDVGADQAFWGNRIRLSATYFENRFTDLIQAILIGGTFLPINVARARSEGVEIGAEADLPADLQLSFNYTHTDTRDLMAHTPLRRVAPDRFNLGLTWNPSRRVAVYALAYIVSSQFESIGFPRNPAFHHIDVGGSYRLVEKRGTYPAVDFIARINNVTDERYMEVFGFRALGINALAGLRATY
jgi:vitamin B12 transporter